MIKRAQRVQAVRGFGIDRVAAAAESGSAPVETVLRMENLDTNLPLPPEAVEVTAAALSTPPANSWLPFTGDHGLRAAVSEFTAARTGHGYDPEREIVVVSGGMEGLLDTLLAVVDPGDQVVVTDPTYAGIVNRIRLAGGVPRFVPFVATDGGWRLDRDALASAVGDRTVAFLLMSPSMPSGGWLDQSDWGQVCDLCRERDLALIYDAAMERLLFDGRPLIHPLGFEGMAERTLVVGSLSKEHRMIGWRVGWVCGPAATLADIGWVHIYNTTMPTAISRAAATAVLRGDQGHVQECVDELQRRRDCILEGLPGWPLVRPAGGWSMLLDVAALGFTPERASQLLLGESGIAATGMTGWGDSVGGRYVRLVFSAESLERLRTIPDRLAGRSLAAAVARR
ncbi:MAG TPA: pyridoxal phosphate-dependent aminotransferase [Candidatus Binatia bacterium]|nr:pyridoxal phosphate-dependent aminotransferase [Candidatus Binatia bacterium]